MSLVLLERHGAVCVLRLNDPKRRNLLSAELCRELREAVRAANADPDARAIVVTGAQPAFCAGADLDDLEAAAAGEVGALHSVYAALMDLAGSELLTVAAVNGPAVGAGLNLALACDLRIASEGASFDCRFLKIGIHPGGGHGWLLLRAVGWAQACHLLLLNRTMRTDEAQRIGLVQDVVSDQTLVAQAVELARRTEALPRDLLTRSKRSLRFAAGSSHAEAFTHEADEQMRSLGEPPFRELVARLRIDMKTKTP